MRNRVVLFLLLSCVLFFALTALAQQPKQDDPLPGTPTSAADAEKPRIFITQSHSWEVGGGGGGVDGTWGSSGGGGARPQTAEIIKTFGQRCPAVIVNNVLRRSDYVVELDHEGGKAFFQHRNKVAVFERISGDNVMSKSSLSVGDAVQEACGAITKHWAANSARMQAAEASAPPSPLGPALLRNPRVSVGLPGVPTLSVSSTPENADIELDGAFVGNTPSRIEVTPGDHTIVVTKKGYQRYERKLKVSGGQIRVFAELEPSSSPH